MRMSIRLGITVIVFFGGGGGGGEISSPLHLTLKVMNHKSGSLNL